MFTLRRARNRNKYVTNVWSFHTFIVHRDTHNLVTIELWDAHLMSHIIIYKYRSVGKGNVDVT